MTFCFCQALFWALGEKTTLFSNNILFRSKKHVVVVNWLSRKKAKERKTGREIEREGGRDGGEGRKEGRKGGGNP